MAFIKCDGCGEIIEIPAELCPDPESVEITEPYYCDACEQRGGTTTHEADQPDGWIDGEPDFTLDDLEWEELFG